jgi:hypothetical protein
LFLHDLMPSRNIWSTMVNFFLLSPLVYKHALMFSVSSNKEYRDLKGPSEYIPFLSNLRKIHRLPPRHHQDNRQHAKKILP